MSSSVGVVRVIRSGVWCPSAAALESSAPLRCRRPRPTAARRSPLPPAPSPRRPAFCFRRASHSGYLTEPEPQSAWVLRSGFFHVAKRPPGPFVSSPVVELASCLCLNDIPLCAGPALYLFIAWWMLRLFLPLGPREL